MRLRTIAALVPLLAVLGGCQPSILPYFSTLDEVSIPELVGTWMEAADEGGGAVWTVNGEAGGYEVICKEGERETNYEMHAFRLEDLLFIDIVQDNSCLSEMLSSDLFLQQHLVARLIPGTDSLLVGILNNEWCVEKLDDEEIKLPFVVMETGYLLTASAYQVRPVLIKYANDPDAFPMTVFYRQQP